MKNLIVAALLGVLSMPAAATAATLPRPAGAPAPLELTRVLGGALVDPVVDGAWVYVATGRIVSTWSHALPAAPLLVDAGTAPARGAIHGLTRWGDYLYASWQAGDDSGGVAVYSLTDPAHPVLVNEFDDYTESSFKQTWTIAAANGYLYVFDQENGIYGGDLGADPLHPTFTRHFRWPTIYNRSRVEGHLVHASGNQMSNEQYHVCTTFDVSDPDAPVAAGGCGGGDPLENFRTRVDGTRAASFGLKLTLRDLADPANPLLLGSIDTPPATDGFLSGDHAYSLGFAGIDIWDIADPSAPVAAGHSNIPTLGASSVTPLADGALVLTSTDRFLRLDVSAPTAPALVSETAPDGGVVTTDVALVEGKAVLLAENYGLGIADARTLTPLARFDASLPEQLNRRDFEQFAVDGGRAYLVAWGYGLVIADLTDPLHPVELGKIEYDYPSAVAASGDYAYIGTVTNGGVVQVVDVSDPAAPVLRGAVTMTSVFRLQVHGDYVYAADEFAGLHVIDVSDPDAPAVVAIYSDGCMGIMAGAYDVQISADGTRAFVACETGLQVVDITNPAAPVRLGGWPAEWANGSTVAVDGDRAWFGDRAGVHEIDVSDETNPAFVATTWIGGYLPVRMRASGDGRLFVFNRQVGTHVLGEMAVTDAIFADGFDAAPVAPQVSTFDELAEGFMGTSMQHGGINWHEVNGIGGVFPDGSTFVPADVGDQLVIEDAGVFYADFPDFGSAPNTLTFGTSFVNGENFSIGALVRASGGLEQPARAIAMDLAYYENGPWGGIVVHLEGYERGTLVASDSLTLAGEGDRDNPATSRLSISAPAIDAFKLHATFNGQPTAPRVMIDNVAVTSLR